MRKTLLKWFYGLFLALCVLLTFGVLWFAFYPSVPNTPTAKRGLQKMVGVTAPEVADIYFYDSGSDFFGDSSQYARFTYPDDAWLTTFLRRLAISPRTKAENMSGPPQSWWDFVTVSQLPEQYYDDEYAPITAIAIDRQRRHVYVTTYTL